MLRMLQIIQNWLFAKVPLVPLEYDDEGYQVCFGGARRHKTIRMDEEEYTFRCQYSPTDPFTGAGRGSAAFPPPHWHRRQEEEFKVFQGSVGYVLDGIECIAYPGTVVKIPIGIDHAFWCDPHSKEDAIMEFTVRPGRGVDEQWINSLYGVLDSHYRIKKHLSFLQAMVLCDEADAAPGGIPKPIGILMVYIFGRILGRLAGYEGTYRMYNESRPPEP